MATDTIRGTITAPITGIQPIIIDHTALIITVRTLIQDTDIIIKNVTTGDVIIPSTTIENTGATDMSLTITGDTGNTVITANIAVTTAGTDGPIMI